MLAQKRQSQIIDIMQKQGGSAKMVELAQHFHVSNETIRRDLEYLQDQGLVQRVYGGAHLTESNHAALPQENVKPLGQRKREAIAKVIADMVQDGERLMLSTGSTVLEVAKQLRHKKGLTIVTNSISVAYALSDTDFDIYILGGKLNNAEMDTYGDPGVQALQGLYADRTIIGAGGLTVEYGISDYNSDDFLVRNEMMCRTGQVIVAAQSDKFGRNAFCIRNPLARADVIVTDDVLPPEYADRLRKEQVNLVIAQL